MNGLLLIDKPAGVTSFDVVRQVRRCCKTRRVGHAGTLDPFATGVLPVAVGQTTRLVEYLMDGDKEYLATMRLGVTTDTQDLEGQVLEERPWQQVTLPALEEVVKKFTGTIQQVPPMYSAIKQNGQPLYKLARKGVEVERKAREVRIDDIEICSFEPPEVTILVSCGKGTYIRTLAQDIGEELGCGAHLVKLRRTRCSQFAEESCISLSALQERAEQGEPIPLVSPADTLARWPGLQVAGDSLSRLKDGVAPAVADLPDADALQADDRVRLLDGERLVALARYTPGGFGKRPGDFEILKVFPPD